MKKEITFKSKDDLVEKSLERNQVAQKKIAILEFTSKITTVYDGDNDFTTGYKIQAILNNFGYTNIYIWEYGSLSNFPFKDMLKI